MRPGIWVIVSVVQFRHHEWLFDISGRHANGHFFILVVGMQMGICHRMFVFLHSLGIMNGYLILAVGMQFDISQRHANGHLP